MTRVATRSRVVCGIDIGSTNTKVVALNGDGRVVFRMAAPTARRSGGLLRAQDVLTTIEQMLLRLGGADYKIQAVSCAGVGEDGLFVGTDEEPLCDILPWYHPDRHSVFERLAPAFAEHPDLPVTTDAARTLVGWTWARSQPGVASARAWVSLADWPSAFWSGRAFMSNTLAARTAAWLPWGGGWMAARVASTIGDADLLPEVLVAGDVVGDLRSATLAGAGVLAPGAVVAAGGHDHLIGGWAVQQLSPRAVVDSMGTAEVVVTQSPRRAVARSPLYDVGPSVEGSGSSVLAVQELARNIEWASRDPDVAHHLRQLVAGTVEPTDDLYSEAFMPGWQSGPSPAYAPHAPMAPLGRASAVLGCLARGGDEKLRAVAQTLSDAPDIFATGGWSRSAGWLAIKETTSGTSFRRIAEPEVTAVAAAMLAARAIGWQTSPEVALGGEEIQT